MKQLFMGVLLLWGALFAQEPLNKTNESYDSQVAKVRAKWRYNPFRNKKDSEASLFGWQDPNAFISRFWMGGIVGINGLYPNAGLSGEDILFAFSPVLATEIAPISFELGRLKMRVGVGFLAELKLHMYKPGKRQYYGKSMFLSDFLNVSLYFDFIIDDVWKLRFIPILHNCAHGNTEFYLSPRVNPPVEFVDVGTESMAFEFYRNWRFLTAYGGFRFAWYGTFASSYSTLFGVYAGIDFRVPLWGYLNFITGVYLGADYDNFHTLRRTESGNKKDGYEILSTRREWNYTAAFGIGLEIDRMSIAFKYRRMRSRHVTSFQNIDQFYGLEATVYF